MSYPLIGKAMKAEHWLVHAFTYARSSLAGPEYGFRAWIFYDY